MVLPFLRTFLLLTQGLHPQKLCKLPWHNCICKLNSSEEWKKRPSAVYLVSSLQRGTKSHFPVLLLNLSSEVLHRACGIKHNNPSEAVHLLGVPKPEPGWCSVTLGMNVFVSSLRSSLSSSVPLPKALERGAWAANTQRPRGEAG